MILLWLFHSTSAFFGPFKKKEVQPESANHRSLQSWKERFQHLGVEFKKKRVPNESLELCLAGNGREVFYEKVQAEVQELVKDYTDRKFVDLKDIFEKTIALALEEALSGMQDEYKRYKDVGNADELLRYHLSPIYQAFDNIMRIWKNNTEAHWSSGHKGVLNHLQNQVQTFIQDIEKSHPLFKKRIGEINKRDMGKVKDDISPAW